MRLLFLGDVFGRSGRDAVAAHVPDLRPALGLDFVVANGENATHGFGLSAEHCDGLFAAGVDVVTGGNHSWDQRDIVAYIADQPRLLRPANYPPGTPGAGAGIFTNTAGKRLLVANVMCRLFMEPFLDDPFAAVDTILASHRLGASIDAAIIDVHGEATSEKQAIGDHCDGRVSLVVGTHSHVPTADQRILPGGTAFQTDAGMCGDYDSVIGMDKAIATPRFTRKVPHERLQPATGPATLCGLVVDTDSATGLATAVHPLRMGGILDPITPPSR